jgi:crossover junction endonuclease EME1
MPVDKVVIDLLSSPEAPSPIPQAINTSIAKAPPYNQQKPSEKEVVSLSSEDAWPDEDSVPKSPTLFGSPSWNFGKLEDPIQDAPLRPTTIKTAKPTGGVFYLEDDFDSTVNFDDSIVIDLPPAKKRRLSSSPISSPRSKNGGYNRSFSNAESSTYPKTTTKSTKNAPLKRSYTTSARLESDPIMFTSSPDPIGDAARRRREKARIGQDSNDELLESDGLLKSKHEGDGILGHPKAQAKGKGKVLAMFDILTSDDDASIIVLNENPPPLYKQTSSKAVSAPSSKGKSISFDHDFSSDLDLLPVGTSKPKPNPQVKSKLSSKSNSISSSTTEILEPYTCSDTTKESMTKSKMSKSKPEPKPKPKSKSKPSSTEDILAAIEAERMKAKVSQEKAEKMATKEAEKEKKQLERERKAREKQKAAEIATVNALRTDRKLTTQEMIVELPACLEKKLATLTIRFLEDVKAAHTEWDSSHPIVKWKRKVVAEYDDGEGQWKPVKEYIKPENHVMYVMNAKDLIQRVTGDEGHDLSTLIATIISRYGSSKIIFLLEGVQAWARRNKNIKNKEFVGAVRSHAPQLEQPSASQRRKKKDDEYVDEELVEEALLEMQVVHGFLIHHTGSVQETAQWIKLFTENISSIPYK